MKTHLLSRLQSWARSLVDTPDTAPRVILLVGGPGNGKTEAIESTVQWMDEALRCDGFLSATLRKQLLPAAGQAVPRVAGAQVPNSLHGRHPLRIRIVQDASVEDVPQQSRAALLAQELDEALATESTHDIYLACVNRGVLDDALIHVSENGPFGVLGLIHSIIQAVGQGGDNAACWPLSGYPAVAVWPMDVESLLVKTRDGDPPPASLILSNALDESKWLPHGECAAKLMCPYCGSRRLLAGNRGHRELLTILRWHELATAKRWTFRDLFTLVSFVLAGSQPSDRGNDGSSPCEMAASLVSLDLARIGRKPNSKHSPAIFVLASSLYQHQLFGQWDGRITRRLREDLRDLGLTDNHTAMGLYYFLLQGRGTRPPAMIEGLLDALGTSLDPALADPATIVPVSDSVRIPLRDIDARFSQSVSSGRGFLSRHKCLSPSEVELLGRLAELDRELSTPLYRKRRPDAATRIQHLVRDYACRFVRRSLCTRAGVTRDGEFLSQFQQIVEDAGGSGELLLTAVREVSRLLNGDDKFEVSLTTTFGQPMPPPALRAVLVTAKQAVRPVADTSPARPLAPMRYLRVGRGKGDQPIALTFDLYRSVRLLSAGLSRASLPREVNALIDATKARLSGPVVRDPDGLDDAVIELGTSGARIELIGGRFLPTVERTP